MVFHATFNNISVITWGSVLLVEETGENDLLQAEVEDADLKKQKNHKNSN